MIDKIKLYTRDFKIGSSTPMIIKQGHVNSLTGEIENEGFLFNRCGKDFYGFSSFLNMELFPTFTLDLIPEGQENDKPTRLRMEFNPNKVYFDDNFHLVDPGQFYEVCTFLKGELEKADIGINIDSCKLGRIDLAKNINTTYPVIAYADVFNFLRAKRMSRRMYPTTFEFSNTQREIAFYDKVAEVKMSNNKIPDDMKLFDNIMRAEIRFKGNQVVERDTELNNLSELYNSDRYLYLGDTYKKLMQDLVFRRGGEYELKIRFVSEIELLKSFKRSNKRNVLYKYLLLDGIEKNILRFGSLDNFKYILKEAGFSRSYICEQMKVLNDLMNMKTLIEVDTQETEKFTSMLDELYQKIAS
jgi:hypothetical protein